MSDQGLQIQVGADVKGAVSGIDQVQKRLAELYAQIDNEKSGQTELISKAAIADSNRQIESVAQEIDKLSVGFKGASSASSAFGASLSQQRVALVDMARIATDSGFSIRSLGSQLSLFPLPIVAAIASVAFLIDKLNLFKSAANDTQDALAGTNKEFDKAAVDVYTLQENIQLAKQGFLDKTEVLKEYNDTIGKTTGQVTSLDEAEKAFEKNAGAYIQFTLLKAAAQVAYGKAADAAFQSALAAQKSAADFQSVLTNLSAFSEGQSSAPGYVPGLDPMQGVAARQAAAQKAKDDAIKNAEDQKNKLLAIGKDFQDQAAAIAKNNNFDFLGGGDNSNIKQIQDDNLQYLEKTKTLIESLSKKDDNPLFKDFAESASGALGDINFNIYKDNLQKATELAASGAIDSGTFDNYVSALNAAFAKQSSPNLLSHVDPTLADTGVDTSAIDTSIHKLDKNIPPITVPVDIDTKLLNDQALQVADNINKILTTSITSGVVSLAESIGNAIGKGHNVLQTAMSSLLSFLGEGIQEIGKQLIVIGNIATVAAAAIKSLLSDPPLTIVAGVAFVAAGAILKSKAQSIHAFADGGVVTGPTNALIGEAGTEVIFPLNQLNRFIRNTQGSGQMQVGFVGKLSGNDIKLSQQRTAKQQRMV
jgi:hypothetical protein